MKDVKIFLKKKKTKGEKRPEKDIREKVSVLSGT